MSYTIAIPSYNRCDQLNNKTLKCLYEQGITKEYIDVFVVEDEYEKYLEHLDKNYYNKLIVGKLGLVQQREFIQSYYPEGSYIINLDDDIQSIDLSFTNYKTLDEFFKDAFQKCRETNIYLWSVYPVFNPFFRQSKDDTTEGLTFCIGAFYGYINRPDKDLQISLTREGNKEDVERSILYWLKDKKVLRFNKIGFKTKYYGVGGLGGLKERIPLMKKYTEILNNKYPTFTKIKIRKNGLYEIVFKKQKDISIPSLPCEKLKPLEPSRDDLLDIYNMLENITIPLQSNKVGRARTFGIHRSMTLGIVKGRISRQYNLSYMSKKFLPIYEAIKTFGETFVPFHFDAIHVNKNVVCPRHIDPTNTGKSCLVSFGDYQGCNLVIENVGEFNTNCQPIVFDGTKSFHYNTPLISGTKYSLVFFTN
jgi:hypothetical protein